MYSDNRRAKLINDVKLKIKKVSPRIRVLEKASEIADLVLSKEEKYASISTKELRNLSYRMMDQIQQGAQLDNFLIDEQFNVSERKLANFLHTTNSFSEKKYFPHRAFSTSTP